MSSAYHMNRLLQGDVGSGKTVVASLAMYAAVLSGLQAAIMVPTEILARQHFANLKNLFPELKISLLVSGLKSCGEKRDTRQFSKWSDTDGCGNARFDSGRC